MAKLFTVCIVQREGAVLLGRKKRGFGAGLWNGFGGKVEAGETPEEAVVRETQEEAGIRVNGLRKRGIITFTFEGKTEPMEVHFWSTSEFAGEPSETEEMSPRWFPVGALPYDDMFADDRHWFPLLLAGKDFGGRAHFKDEYTIISHDIRETDDVR